MEQRTFETNPIVGRMVPAAVLGGLGTLAGVVLIVAAGALVSGIVLIAGTGVVEAWLIVRAIVQLDCPECGRRLERVVVGRRYACSLCEIEWCVPGGGA